MKTYRALLHLYPRRFRREYGDDMVALLEDQLRDEGALRVVARTVLDLVLTIPTRHLEARMKRSSSIALVTTFVALALGAAVVGGPAGIVVALALLALATIAWRREQPVVARGDGRWWKLLLSGVGLLTTLVIVTTITGELPDGMWYLAMATMLTSFGLIGAGVVLGIAGRFGARTA